MSVAPPAPSAAPLAPDAALRFVFDHHPDAILACSFQAEDIVVLHMMLSIRPQARAFALDTGRLPESTFEVAEAVRARFGDVVDWYFPQATAVERLVSTQGPYGFRRSVEERKACCHIRKVEPLARALAGRGAWITGLRREQAATRGVLAQFEQDNSLPGPHGKGLLKCNPIVAWTTAEVWDYIRAFDLPVHPLYDQGYRQIGCAPCTTAVRPGEDDRAGRWRWEHPTSKECGLHTAKREASTGPMDSGDTLHARSAK